MGFVVVAMETKVLGRRTLIVVGDVGNGSGGGFKVAGLVEYKNRGWLAIWLWWRLRRWRWYLILLGWVVVDEDDLNDEDDDDDDDDDNNNNDNVCFGGIFGC